MVNIDHAYANGTVSGATVAAYVEVLTIDNCAGALIQISNTDTAAVNKDLKYKISGYLSAHASCVETAIVSETTLAEDAASGVLSDVNRPYAKVVVSIKSGESTATTYQVDWIAY